jgi:hypothetical protein
VGAVEAWEENMPDAAGVMIVRGLRLPKGWRGAPRHKTGLAEIPLRHNLRPACQASPDS